MSSATLTTDHDEIRQWTEKREGRPTIVSDTDDNGRNGGVLRIDFGDKDEALEEIGWDRFFSIFDANDLAFLRSEGDSRFNKFVTRADAEA
jgi:hypothetical protein